MHASDHTQEVTNHLEKAMQLLEAGQDHSLSDFLDELHPVELVSVVNAAPIDAQESLLHQVTGLDRLAEVLEYANEPLQAQIIGLLDESRIAAVVRRMEIDDAADVVGILSRRRQTSVLRRLSASTVKELTSLLAYDQQTAGGIMTTLFLSFPKTLMAEEAMTQLRSRLHKEELDPDIDITYIYILDEQEQLEGVCSLRELLTATPYERLEKLMTLSTISVTPDEDQENVARLMSNYDFTSIPVVDPESAKMLGIVTVDDVLDVIEEEHTEDLLKLVGTEDQDTVGATMGTAVRSRIPWLLASWAGGIGGAMLLGGYSTTLEKVVALAFFMPVVFGMGGNVGSQASTITVRGIATGDLSPSHILPRLKKEALVGLMLGCVFGVLLGGAAYVLFQEISLSIIVSLSILTTMTCAASLGSMLPLIFQKFGYDPAVASGPLVTTSTDILSIVIYFSIAGALL